MASCLSSKLHNELHSKHRLGGFNISALLCPTSPFLLLLRPQGWRPSAPLGPTMPFPNLTSLNRLSTLTSSSIPLALGKLKMYIYREKERERERVLLSKEKSIHRHPMCHYTSNEWKIKKNIYIYINIIDIITWHDEKDKKELWVFVIYLKSASIYVLLHSIKYDK